MNIVIILAGGKGSRMNCKTAKQHIIVNKHQIIEYTLTAFSLDIIDYIIVVSNFEYMQEIEKLKTHYPKVVKVVSGGKTRTLSVLNGLKALNFADGDNIIISDAARPCITNREIYELIQKLKRYNVVTTGIPSYETIMKIRNGEIEQITPRNGIIRQTSPEAYKFKVLKGLYFNRTEAEIEKFSNIGIDILFKNGEKIGIVESNPLNFKITTQSDIKIFESVLSEGFDKVIKEEGYVFKQNKPTKEIK